MRRRTLLGTLAGTGVSGSLGGCLGVLDGEVACEPAEEDVELGSLVDEGLSRDDPYRVQIRGTVAHFPDRGAVIDDGTGPAYIYPGARSEINRDLVERGDCVTTEGTFHPDSVRRRRRPSIAINDLEVAGEAERPVPDEGYAVPDASVDISFSRDRPTDRTGTLTFTHEGGDAVPADELTVYHWYSDHYDTFEGVPWRELDGAAESGETVEAGDAASLELGRDHTVSLVWETDRYADALVRYGT